MNKEINNPAAKKQKRKTTTIRIPISLAKQLRQLGAKQGKYLDTVNAEVIEAGLSVLDQSARVTA